MTTTDSNANSTLGWTANDATFGARLALIRQRMGWGNIAMAAKECGVPTDSWRNWEVDGREPRRLVTISMAIASRTGCDYLWLVHGPERGGAVRTTTESTYGAQRVVARVGGIDRMIGQVPTHTPHTRSVRQTRPAAGASLRPATPVAV